MNIALRLLAASAVIVITAVAAHYNARESCAARWPGKPVEYVFGEGCKVQLAEGTDFWPEADATAALAAYEKRFGGVAR